MAYTRIPYPPVTKEQFLAYEAVRHSGVADMFDVETVSQLSGLDQETILAIMEHYAELVEKYLDEDGGSGSHRSNR